jgi:hypothetical protein
VFQLSVQVALVGVLVYITMKKLDDVKEELREIKKALNGTSKKVR